MAVMGQFESVQTALQHAIASANAQLQQAFEARDGSIKELELQKKATEIEFKRALDSSRAREQDEIKHGQEVKVLVDKLKQQENKLRLEMEAEISRRQRALNKLVFDIQAVAQRSDSGAPGQTRSKELEEIMSMCSRYLRTQPQAGSGWEGGGGGEGQEEDARASGYGAEETVGDFGTPLRALATSSSSSSNNNNNNNNNNNKRFGNRERPPCGAAAPETGQTPASVPFTAMQTGIPSQPLQTCISPENKSARGSPRQEEEEDEVAESEEEDDTSRVAVRQSGLVPSTPTEVKPITAHSGKASGIAGGRSNKRTVVKRRDGDASRPMESFVPSSLVPEADVDAEGTPAKFMGQSFVPSSVNLDADGTPAKFMGQSFVPSSVILDGLGGTLCEEDENAADPMARGGGHGGRAESMALGEGNADGRERVARAESAGSDNNLEHSAAVYGHGASFAHSYDFGAETCNMYGASADVTGIVSRPHDSPSSLRHEDENVEKNGDGERSQAILEEDDIDPDITQVIPLSGAYRSTPLRALIIYLAQSCVLPCTPNLCATSCDLQYSWSAGPHQFQAGCSGNGKAPESEGSYFAKGRS